MTTGNLRNMPELRNWYQIGKIFGGDRFDKRRRLWVRTYTEYGAVIEKYDHYMILRGRAVTYILWPEHKHRYKQNVPRL